MVTRIAPSGILIPSIIYNKLIVSFTYENKGSTCGRKTTFTRRLPFSVKLPLPETIGLPVMGLLFCGSLVDCRKWEL